MKARHLLFPLAAIFIFVSCRGNENENEDNGPFPHVGAYYCVEVRETQNTCSEPRDLPSPIMVLYRQVIATNGEPTSRVTFIGGGLEFPADLDSDGYLTAYSHVFDENIDFVTYSGKFTGTNGLVNYHETAGQDEDEPCSSAAMPCHLRIQYENGACLEEAAGYNVIALWGPRIATDGGCPIQFMDNEARFSVLP